MFTVHLEPCSVIHLYGLLHLGAWHGKYTFTQPYCYCYIVTYVFPKVLKWCMRTSCCIGLLGTAGTCIAQLFSLLSAFVQLQVENTNVKCIFKKYFCTIKTEVMKCIFVVTCFYSVVHFKRQYLAIVDRCNLTLQKCKNNTPYLSVQC